MSNPDTKLLESQFVAALDQGVAGIDELLGVFRDHPERLSPGIGRAAKKVSFVPRLERIRTELLQANEDLTKEDT